EPGAPPEGSVFFRWDRPARTGPWGPSAPASSTQEEDPGTAPEILVRQRHAWGESPHLAARPLPPHRSPRGGASHRQWWTSKTAARTLVPPTSTPTTSWVPAMLPPPPNGMGRPGLEPTPNLLGCHQNTP